MKSIESDLTPFEEETSLDSLLPEEKETIKPAASELTTSEKRDLINKIALEYYNLRQKSRTTKKNIREKADELMEKMMGYIDWVATKYMSREGISIPTIHGNRIFSGHRARVGIEDVSQEGLMAVFQKLDEYDPNKSKGSTFFTYATIIAVTSMHLYTRENYGIVRLPMHMHLTSSRSMIHTKTAEETIEYISQAHPSLDREAAAVTYNLAKGNYVSTDAAIKRNSDEPSNAAYGDFLAEQTSGEGQEDLVARMQLQQKIGDALIRLNPREEAIIRLRYGMEAGDNLPLNDVGNIFNMTAERVRQIQSRAERKLRQLRIVDELRQYLQS